MNQQKNTGDQHKKLQHKIGGPHRICYSQQLLNDLHKAEKKLKEQEKKVYQDMKTNHPEFMQEYQKLNDLRLKVDTIKSRLDNINYHPGGMEPAQLIIINNNKFHNE